MKKWSMLILSAMLLVPLSGQAEDLPDFLSAVSQGVSEGLTQGAALSAAAQELTLEMTMPASRIEEGETLSVTLSAGNPYPQKMPVTLTLLLPERLSCRGGVSWEAELDAACVDPTSGKLIPSVTTFTREVTLVPGGVSEQAELTAEMSMGTRFYRAKAALELCVPLISASASVLSENGALVKAGETFAYEISVVNDGAAPKDVGVSMLLPAGVSPEGDLPAGFTMKNNTISGVTPAGAGSSSVIRMAMRVDEDALSAQKDASRLLSGVLTVDGERISLPRLRAVGPVINAALSASRDTLEEGKTMDLAITVVNTGLAEADVELSCLLPEGLSVVSDAARSKDDKPEGPKETPLAVGDGDGGKPASPDVAPAMAQANTQPQIRESDGALVFSLHMDAAKETDSGVAAAAKEIMLRVRADEPMDNIGDRLLGASLAWRTDDGDVHLSEAEALRIRRTGFMGLSDSEWNGILLAALLMMVTICCLYSALKSDGDEDEYCFE